MQPFSLYLLYLVSPLYLITWNEKLNCFNAKLRQGEWKGTWPHPRIGADAVILTDTGCGGHILEVTLLRLLCRAFLILQSLKKLEQSILGDLTPSSFQVGKAREAEIHIQIMGLWIKWSPHGHRLLLLNHSRFSHHLSPQKRSLLLPHTLLSLLAQLCGLLLRECKLKPV